MPKAAFYTFGCKLNQVETESIASVFSDSGWQIGSIHEQADLYCINTCTVTSKSEQKARKLIRKVSRDYPQTPIIVTGCYTELNQQDIASLAENIIALKGNDKSRLLKLAEFETNSVPSVALIKDFLLNEQQENATFLFPYTSPQFHTRAFVKIQDGCNNTCSYCRVRLARGKARSNTAYNIIKQCLKLEENGVKEIILTGVNISQYQEKKHTLSDLLYQIVEATKKVRIRLSSLEPDMITPELRQSLENDRICPHFHLPVQSGDDTVLSLMNRKYKAQHIEKAINGLRKIKEDPFIAADIITGFPGESEENFYNTKKLVEKCNITKLHVFPYSPRPGTAAYSFKEHVPERITRQRSSILRTLSQDNLKAYINRNIGKVVYPIVENIQEENYICEGTTENYLHVYWNCRKNDTKPLVGEKQSVFITNLDNSGRIWAAL